MTRNRYDETWHRLREWTKGQAPSERLAAQILLHEGFSDVDPSHPLGGKDGGKDAIATKGVMRFAMAVYFPRGQQSSSAIKAKFECDLAGARRNCAEGIAFVTNQELMLSEREHIKMLAAPTIVELYHLERITTILDSPDMASIREQFLDIRADSFPDIWLGGLGGTGLCAGGGGGGATGRNATGGMGGAGGDINLQGLPGQAPGAGGGGAGAVGDGSVGGEGGGGGECVVAIDVDMSGLHHLEYQIGNGGVGGPGEDTFINFCDEAGRVLKRMVAKGGNAGAPPYVPPPSRLPTMEDLQAGLKVTGVLAAEFIRLRGGLWTLVEAGWDFWETLTIPFRVPLPLLVEIETGAISPGTILDLRLVVRSPDGLPVHEQGQAITVNDSLIRRSRFAVVLDLSGSQLGLWRVQFLAGSQVIGDFAFEIRMGEYASPKTV